MKETTYNKYKRQNKEMRAILNQEVFNFSVNKRDFEQRLNYLKKCIQMYRGCKG